MYLENITSMCLGIEGCYKMLVGVLKTKKKTENSFTKLELTFIL